jgi:hypothetical protein
MSHAISLADKDIPACPDCLSTDFPLLRHREDASLQTSSFPVPARGLLINFCWQNRWQVIGSHSEFLDLGVISWWQQQ